MTLSYYTVLFSVTLKFIYPIQVIYSGANMSKNATYIAYKNNIV